MSSRKRSNQLRARALRSSITDISMRFPNVYPPSLRANGSRECAPDDRLREAIHRAAQRKNGLLRRSAPRNDAALVFNVSATVVSSRSRWERWTEDVALDVPCAAECAELKLLHTSPRCGVVVPPCIDQFKALSERCGESVRVVTADHQAAAAFRAVGREGRDDGMSARAQGASKPGNVSRLIIPLGEKVKRRPVVPQIIGPRRLPRGYISRNPCHPVCLVADAGSRGTKRCSRQIEHCYVLIAPRNQVIDEARGAAANVN